MTMTTVSRLLAGLLLGLSALAQAQVPLDNAHDPNDPTWQGMNGVTGRTQEEINWSWRTMPYWTPQAQYLQGAARQYYLGDRLPLGYLHQFSVLNDWRRYGLQAPPVGYQWMQGHAGEVMLVQPATGLIASLLSRR